MKERAARASRVCRSTTRDLRSLPRSPGVTPGSNLWALSVTSQPRPVGLLSGGGGRSGLLAECWYAACWFGGGDSLIKGPDKVLALMAIAWYAQIQAPLRQEDIGPILSATIEFAVRPEMLDDRPLF